VTKKISQFTIALPYRGLRACRGLSKLGAYLPKDASAPSTSPSSMAGKQLISMSDLPTLTVELDDYSVLQTA